MQPGTRLSPPLRRQSTYEILLQHDWLLIFSRQNRFAETHSHLQLSYHITDRLLAAGNYRFPHLSKLSYTCIYDFGWKSCYTHRVWVEYYVKIADNFSDCFEFELEKKIIIIRLKCLNSTLHYILVNTVHFCLKKLWEIDNVESMGDCAHDF